MSDTVQVTEIRPSGVPIRKGGYDGKHFVGTRVLVLEDGRELEAADTVNRLKRDTVAACAEIGAPRRPYSVLFADDGSVIGFETTYDLRGNS